MNYARNTPQVIFDRALYGIRVQGGPATRDDGTCLYRAPNGNRCGLGVQLDDQVYDPAFDENQVGAGWAMGLNSTRSPEHARFREAMAASGISVECRELVYAIQQAHDDAAAAANSKLFMMIYEGRMQTIASKFKLHYDAPRNLD